VPSVAETVTLFPSDTPVISISGVSSPVMLSVSDKPVSELATRSGEPDSVGATVSISKDRAEVADDTLPLLSVRIAVTSQIPSASDGKLQLASVDESKEHVTEAPSFVAVTVTVLPNGTLENSIVGVESDVMLSESETPESDDAAKAGTDGAAIAVTVTLIDALVN
jgi:hypothetical protein